MRKIVTKTEETLLDGWTMADLREFVKTHPEIPGESKAKAVVKFNGQIRTLRIELTEEGAV